MYDQNFEEESTRAKFTNKVIKLATEQDSKPRCLSTHVGSRWYRAPEVILMQKHYDSAQDMWAIGCVLFELFQVLYPSLQIIQEGVIDPILFKGNECYPLSLQQLDNQFTRDKDLIDLNDQIRVILRQIQELEHIDFCFLENVKPFYYLQHVMQLTKNENVQHYTSRLNTQILPLQYKLLLQNLLQFNPYMRWSARECLD